MRLHKKLQQRLLLIINSLALCGWIAWFAGLTELQATCGKLDIPQVEKTTSKNDGKYDICNGKWNEFRFQIFHLCFQCRFSKFQGHLTHLHALGNFGLNGSRQALCSLTFALPT